MGFIHVFIVASVLGLPLATFPSTEPPPPVPADGLGLDPGPEPPPIPPATGNPPIIPLSPPPLPPSGPGPYSVFFPIFTALGATTVVRRRSEAERAHDEIVDALRDGLSNDVGRSDLLAVRNALERLTPRETTDVFRALSDGQLKTWLRELDGWRGSLDQSEEAEMFSWLVPRLPADTILRLFDAGGKASVLLTSLENTPTPTIMTVLAGLAVRDTVLREDPALATSAMVGLADHTYGKLVASEEFPVLVRALSSATVLSSPFGVSGHTTEAYDLESLSHIAARASLVDDPAVRSIAFTVLSGRLEEISGRANLDTSVAFTSDPKQRFDPLANLSVSMATLLDHESLSVLNHRDDVNGNHMSSWVRQAFEHSGFEISGALIGRLKGEDPLSRFTAPGPSADPYPNASNLGYVIGAHHRAIVEIADDNRSQIELFATLAGLVAKYVPKPPGVSLPAGTLIDVGRDQVVARIESEATSVKQALWAFGKPRNPDGSLWNGAGTSEYQNAWEEVVEVR